jgi:selenide,water dikinase
VLPQVAFLNGPAIEIALRYEIHACTDITGFALAGHALEMARGSGLMIEIDFSALPIHPNVPGDVCQGGDHRQQHRQPQAGGRQTGLGSEAVGNAGRTALRSPDLRRLLLAVAADQADSLLRDYREAGIEQTAIIGQTRASDRAGIRVV